MLFRLNDNRHWVSAVSTAALAAGLLAAPRQEWRASAHAPVEAIELRLAEAPPPEPVLAPPLPTPPEQPKPRPIERVQPMRPLAPAPAPVPAAPAAAPAPVSAPAPAPQPVAAPSPVPPPAPPALPQAAPSTVEDPFIGQLRARLNTNKRYPTGREASLQRPSGKVVVWFVLTRSGALQDAGIEVPSESILLDNAALATVRRSAFPPFPDQAWSGSPSHRFSATLDYLPPS